MRGITIQPKLYIGQHSMAWGLGTRNEAFSMIKHTDLRPYIWLAIAILCLMAGCASKQNKSTMTAAEEARYAAAIENADAQQPPMIETGETVIVNATGNISEGALADREDNAVESQNTPVQPSRSFKVSRSEYDDFFTQSPPPVILSWFDLDPVRDGTSLLGYRIKSIRKPFEGVDIRANDIIVGIDGVMPQTPDNYFSSWEKAKASNTCRVNIQRDVDRFDLTWTVE